MRIVFQGDSITDCGRDRRDSASLGSGYVREVLSRLPEDWACFNRGVSGDRVYDLEARWKQDCLDLKPDVVTIMIGINDTWRRFDSRIESPISEFEASLARICLSVVDTGAMLILMEPFLLPIPEDRMRWREDLDPRIQAVRRVALDFAESLVPLDGFFAAAACRYGMAELAEDGVHPTKLGHELIAKSLVPVIMNVVYPSQSAEINVASSI